MDYRLNGKRKTVSLGTYRDVKLKKARKRREAPRGSIDDGLDPSDIRKEEKVAREYKTNKRPVPQSRRVSSVHQTVVNLRFDAVLV